MFRHRPPVAWTRLLLPLLVLVLASFAASPSAEAAGGKKALKRTLKKAQKQVEKGQDLFRQEEYSEAAKTFLKAEETMADAGREAPAPLYRALARCDDLLAQPVAAVRYYKRFLSLVAQTDRKPKAKLKKAIKEARGAVQRLESTLERTALDF